MAYTPQVWTNAPSTSSPLSAARLNTAEAGIGDASDRLDAVEPRVNALEATPIVSAEYDGATVGGVVAVDDVTGGTATGFRVASTHLYPEATDAAIRAAAAALAAAGGGVVHLPATAITLTAALPVYSGVHYQGQLGQLDVAGSVVPGAYIADGEWTYTGGTRLVGDGTFRAFEANFTDLGSAPADLGTTQISNFGIDGVELDGFTDGIRIGASNIMGLVWGHLRNIFIKNCSGWGIYLANYVHMDIANVRTCLCQNGQYYAARMAALTYQGGNSIFGELYTLIPRDGRDNRLCRGIVFEALDPAGSTAAMNEIEAHRIQVNGFNRALLSATATITSGNTSIAVPDGTKFAVGMPLIFTTANFGFAASQVYVVKSVVGNAVTLANSRSSTAISPSGSGTLTINTYGFANVEITSTHTGGKVQASRFRHIDSEGSATIAVYAENTSNVDIEMTVLPATCLVDLVGRAATYTRWRSPYPAATDFDAGSTTSSEFYGTRRSSVQRPLRGLWTDNASGTTALQISGGSAGQQGGELQIRQANFIYPAAGMGEHIFPRDSAVTLGGQNCGLVVFASASSVTHTLPTIVTDTGTVSTSHIGVWYEVCNVGTGTVTLATDGTQLFNKIVGKTSLTVSPGSSTKVVAVKDQTGNLFWLAKAPLALVTS